MRAFPSLLLLSLAATLCSASQQKTHNTPAHSVQQLVELTAPDGVVGGFYGSGVAISSDGNTVAIGSTNNASDGGAVYVYEKPAAGWKDATLTAELTVPGAFLFGKFAMSPDGATIVASVTILNELIPQVYVFVRPSNGWVSMTPTAALHATHGGVFDFGWSIATDGNIVLVGGLGCSGNGDFSSGAAYLFVKPAGGWTDMTETGNLRENDPLGCDDFGSSVAIQGNTAVVGRTGGGMTPPVSPGALYVYTMPASGWATMSETAKLSTQSKSLLNGLGSSESISGSTILAPAPLIQGTPNSSGAYIYTQPTAGWGNSTQTATLKDTNKGVTSLGFGGAVNGSTVGLIAKYNGGTFSALVLYFEPSGGWQNTSVPDVTAFPSDEAANDFFGESGLAMGGGFVVVGSPIATRNGNSAQGAAYIFQQK